MSCLSRAGHGLGYRIYQARKPKNRHLVDLRQVEMLPETRRIEDVLVLAPAQLIGAKTISMVERSRTAKGLIDEADVWRLLLAFPELKTESGPVRASLEAAGASAAVVSKWLGLVAQEILRDEEEGS